MSKIEIVESIEVKNFRAFLQKKKTPFGFRGSIIGYQDSSIVTIMNGGAPPVGQKELINITIENGVLKADIK